MPRGGFRPGSGRKSDAENALAREIMSKFVTEGDWGAMVRAMQAAARKGNVRAFIALWDRGIGPPAVSVPPDPDEAPLLIRTISIVDPPDADPEDGE